MKYLLKVTEEYRFDTEKEVDDFLEETKNNQRGFVLAKYATIHREKKVKGEIEDEWYKVSVIKEFCNEKEPTNNYEVSYYRTEEE